MLTRIALVSTPGSCVLAIRQQLRNPLRFTLREFLSMEDVNKSLSQFIFDVLIVRVPYFSADSISRLERIRRRFPNEGLITVATEVDPGSRFQVRQIEHHKLVQSGLELNDLAQIVDKLKAPQPSYNRMHPRARRNGAAEILDPQTGVKAKVNFVDFAQMGACLEVALKTEIFNHYSPKMRMQLHYESSTEPGKIHRIEAQVMWVEKSPVGVETLWSASSRKVGLRFIAAL